MEQEESEGVIRGKEGRQRGRKEEQRWWREKEVAKQGNRKTER